jgi:hypothetical protein
MSKRHVYSSNKKVGRDAKKGVLAQNPRCRDFGAPYYVQDRCGWSCKQQASTQVQQDFNAFFAPAVARAEQAVRGRDLREGKPGAFNPESDDRLELRHLKHLGEAAAAEVWAVVVSMRELLAYNSTQHKKQRLDWVRRHGLHAKLCAGPWLLRKVVDLNLWCKKYF